MCRANDDRGKMFGNLVVIGMAKRRKWSAAGWEVRDENDEILAK
jgi:hypothetical protein